MSEDYFRLSTEASIAHLELNRPDQLNRMDFEFFTRLREIVQALDADGAVRVLVISSTRKHFRRDGLRGLHRHARRFRHWDAAHAMRCSKRWLT